MILTQLRLFHGKHRCIGNKCETSSVSCAHALITGILARTHPSRSCARSSNVSHNNRRVIRFDIGNQSYDSVGIIYEQVLLWPSAGTCSTYVHVALPIIMRDLIRDDGSIRRDFPRHPAFLIRSNPVQLRFDSRVRLISSLQKRKGLVELRELTSEQPNLND